MCFFFFQAEDGIRDLVRSRGLGDVYKRQGLNGCSVKAKDTAPKRTRGPNAYADLYRHGKHGRSNSNEGDEEQDVGGVHPVAIEQVAGNVTAQHIAGAAEVFQGFLVRKDALDRPDAQ